MCRHESETFASSTDAPSQARRFVSDAMTQVVGGPHGVIDDAVLVVSELVTNATNAGADEIVVELDIHHRMTRVGVEDDGQGTPEPHSASETDEHGRGLAIVSTLTDGWQIRPTDGGKQVWADVPADPPFTEDHFHCER